VVKFGSFDSGEWLSRLERSVHIREVTGSNPVSPTGFPQQCPGICLPSPFFQGALSVPSTTTLDPTITWCSNHPDPY
jgi:hypothetical protein